MAQLGKGSTTPTLTHSNPKYRKHRASRQAVVSLNGHDHYLGPHGTKASHLEYDRLIALWLANGRRLPSSGDDLTIVEMLAAFRRFAVKHYHRPGRPTRSLGNIDDAVKPLKLLYGRERVRDFGPLKLQAVQALFVKGYADAKGNQIKGVSRGVVNSRISKVKMVFRWAVSQEMAPASLAHALNTVRGLQRGRTEAYEPVPVKPVSDADVDATLPCLTQPTEEPDIDAADCIDWEDSLSPPDAPCPKCGSLAFWRTALGVSRCQNCDPPTAAQRLLEHVESIRRRYNLPPPPDSDELLAAMRLASQSPPGPSTASPVSPATSEPAARARQVLPSLPPDKAAACARIGAGGLACICPIFWLDAYGRIRCCYCQPAPATAAVYLSLRFEIRADAKAPRG